MNTIEINKTYHFDLTGTISFGGLPEELLYEAYKDGRYSSHLLEAQLPVWFPQLTHVKGCADHDHIDTDGVKYDAKNFTRSGGLRFMPSNQIGAGRKFNKELAHEKAKKLVYICCDIVDFPKVRVRFAQGSELVKDYPKCAIPKSKRETFFK